MEIIGQKITTNTCMRKHCLICSFGQEEDFSTLTIFHHHRHSFPVRSELKSVQYFILNSQRIKVDFCRKQEHISYQWHFPSEVVIIKKPKSFIPRILPFLLIKIILKREAAYTRASSSRECALYEIDPVLLWTCIKEIIGHYCKKSTSKAPAIRTVQKWEFSHWQRYQSLICLPININTKELPL